MNTEIYGIGDIVEVIDQIDCETLTTATIRMIEPDSNIDTLFWLYLIANNESINMNYDPRIGNFWRLIANTDPYLRLVCKATTA